MKNVCIVIATLCFSCFVLAQEKYLTKTGIVTFEASVPSFEEVKAKTESTTVILNADNGEFAALVFVKGFRFKNALMEEHFNENYAESDQFPKAKFRGKLSNFNISKVSDQKTEFKYTGSLEFHGKTKSLKELIITIHKNGNETIVLEGKLSVNTDDFDIEIPKIVSNKLSKTVNIEFNFELKKK